ncbi:MAG: hypothetical protein JWQ19_2134 [Subtercola sp.]|nr:hypothetical protein [Subtercola sp.]
MAEPLVSPKPRRERHDRMQICADRSHPVERSRQLPVSRARAPDPERAGFGHRKRSRHEALGQVDSMSHPAIVTWPSTGASELSTGVLPQPAAELPRCREAAPLPRSCPACREAAPQLPRPAAELPGLPRPAPACRGAAPACREAAPQLPQPAAKLPRPAAKHLGQPRSCPASPPRRLPALPLAQLPPFVAQMHLPSPPEMHLRNAALTPRGRCAAPSVVARPGCDAWAGQSRCIQ